MVRPLTCVLLFFFFCLCFFSVCRVRKLNNDDPARYRLPAVVTVDSESAMEMDDNENENDMSDNDNDALSTENPVSESEIGGRFRFFMPLTS